MLDLTLDIQSLTATASVLGGPNKSYANRLTSVPCSFKQRSVATTDGHGMPSIVTVYRFYVEATAANRNIVGSDRVIYDSRTFEITGIYNVAGKNEILQIETLEVT